MEEKSCLTNLMTFYNEVTCSIDMERAVDSVILDFVRMSDAVSHNILIDTQVKCGLGK